MASLGSDGNWSFTTVGRSALIVLGKVAGFAAIIYMFAHWVEPHVTRLFKSIGKPPHPMLLIARCCLSPPLA